MVEKPRNYLIAEKTLICPICNSNIFFCKKIKLNNTIAGFLGIEENIRSVTGYICSECNHVIPFLNQ